MKEVKEPEELEELEELEEEDVTKNAYVEHVNKLRARGREILLRHIYRLSTFKAVSMVEGASPMAKRILNRNEGSAPTVFFRVYCRECGKMRTLLIFPSRREVELRGSCAHVITDAMGSILRAPAHTCTTNRTLVYVGEYRVVPVGLATLLGLKILG